MPRPSINPADEIEREFAQEKASALGRLGRTLEAALAALLEFDRKASNRVECRQMRAALVSEASVALWHFVVQREACGLRDTPQVLRDQVLRDYAVPPEVMARMGALPSRSQTPRWQKNA